ncbi:MAG: pyridoxamine 5'-phosphate oxidase family protein, partial [Gammaproteobacteria bacterium]|nr:pyridoxamine 5'-phosphate oxidase family protein [Gammaproteobacteria bacterium]
MSQIVVTQRTKLKRAANRAVFQRDRMYQILDEALICHVAFVENDEPRMVPTAILRIDDAVYVHGNRTSRMIRALEDAMACITVTHIDGVVVARSGFHCSMNYRSVVIYARGEKLLGKEKRVVLDAFVEALIPGRLADMRDPTPKELRATGVVRLALDEASIKVREGGPIDLEDDYAAPIWAGVVP